MPSVLKSECIDNDWSLGDRKHRYSAKYRVTTDTRAMSGLAVAILAQSATPDPLPAYFASYALYGASDPSALAQDFSGSTPDPDKHATVWIFSVGWRPLEGDQDDDHTSQDNPLDRPLRIRVDQEEVEELVENGYNDDALPNVNLPGETGGRAADTFGPICNSAGQQPDTPLTRPRKIDVLVIRKNFATIDEIVALRNAFNGKLNNATFYGAPARKALCRSITMSDEMSAGGVEYREAEFQIAGDPNGFSIPLVNCGWKHFNDDLDLVEAKVLDKEATEEAGSDVFVPVSEPVNLDLDGKKVADGETGTSLGWRVNDLADFSGLGIGGV